MMTGMMAATDGGRRREKEEEKEERKKIKERKEIWIGLIFELFPKKK